MPTDFDRSRSCTSSTKVSVADLSDGEDQVATKGTNKGLEGHDDWVNTVAFSADGQRLASASDDKTVKIWDRATGQCLQTVDVGPSMTNLSFAPDGSYLPTEVGVIKVESSPRLQVITAGSVNITAATATAATVEDHTFERHGAKQDGYSLSLDRSWITRNGQNVLWLPPEYRAQCSAVLGRTVCIGCRSGRVLFFGFSPDS